jgi:hypothetical protein
MLKGFNYPLTPKGKSTLNPPPPWYYSSDFLNIMQIAEWKYRTQLPGFELPEAIAVEQREYDERLAESLDAMAARMEGRFMSVELTLEDAVARLERAINIYHPKAALSSHFQALFVLGRRIESSMVFLTNEIGTEQLGAPTLY